MCSLWFTAGGSLSVILIVYDLLCIAGVLDSVMTCLLCLVHRWGSLSVDRKIKATAQRHASELLEYQQSIDQEAMLAMYQVW